MVWYERRIYRFRTYEMSLPLKFNIDFHLLDYLQIVKSTSEK